MSDTVRKFNAKLYEQCDMTSKLASIFLMESRGYEVLGDVNEEHYKEYDLKFENKETKKNIAIENEFRGNFKKIKEFFPTVHIPIRKKNSQCDFYFVWGLDYTEVGVINMLDVTKFVNDPVKVKCTLANRLYGSPEYSEEFIDVPKELVKFFKKNEKGIWKRIQ